MNKKLTIFVLALVLILSTTLGFAYASKTVEDVHEDISALSYAGPFEEIGGAIGEAIDNTAKSITKIAGKTLKDLIDYTVDKFKDVKVSDWFIDTVSKFTRK